MLLPGLVAGVFLLRGNRNFLFRTPGYVNITGVSNPYTDVTDTITNENNPSREFFLTTSHLSLFSNNVHVHGYGH